MNTVSFTPLPTGQVRVTIHSEGERDQSALVASDAFLDLVRSAGWIIENATPAPEESA